MVGEKITDRGIGNGISLLIMIGIIATLPQAIAYEFTNQFGLTFVIEIAALFFVVMATVLIVQAVRKIPIQFAKRWWDEVLLLCLCPETVIIFQSK